MAYKFRMKIRVKKIAIKNNTAIFALPKGNDSVAQSVEQYTFNVWVLGSSPSGITKSLS